MSEAAPPEATSEAAPEAIGKYRVEEKIAEGGFATLYRGSDPYLKRTVAIKLCSSADANLRHQFLQEAEVAGRLDHPNIVTTFDFGFADEHPYMVQEYLAGEDLWEKIARRDELSYPKRMCVLVQVAKALHYTHSLGVLHLDVKPSNVRVLDNGRVKVFDFGIARIGDRDGETAETAMGTAGYMPLEQVTGADVDETADVFAFAALAYEALTYRRPFPGESVQQILKQVIRDRHEPVRSSWPDCPPVLEGLLDRCLSKNREERIQSFGELLPILIDQLHELPLDDSDRTWEAGYELAGRPVVNDEAEAEEEMWAELEKLSSFNEVARD